MQVAALNAVAFARPDFSVAQVKSGATLCVEQCSVDTKTDATQGQVALYTGRIAKRLVGAKQVLLKMEVGYSGACYHAPTAVLGFYHRCRCGNDYANEA